MDRSKIIKATARVRMIAVISAMEALERFRVDSAFASATMLRILKMCAILNVGLTQKRPPSLQMVRSKSMIL